MGHLKLKEPRYLEVAAVVHLLQPAHFLGEVVTRSIALLAPAQTNLEEEASVGKH